MNEKAGGAGELEPKPDPELEADQRTTTWVTGAVTMATLVSAATGVVALLPGGTPRGIGTSISVVVLGAAGWVIAEVRVRKARRAGVDLFSRFRDTHYRRYLVAETKAFDTKGLATSSERMIELERVFVQLALAERAPHRLSVNPLRAADPIAARTVWDHLAAGGRGHFAVIGPPGIGKTTLLRHIARVLADDRRRRREAGAPERIPILVYLRDHIDLIGGRRDVTLADIARAKLPRRVREREPRGWFERQLELGRCLVMLDGLDEIADPAVRGRFAEWLERQVYAYDANLLLITSRPHGYADSHLPLSTLEILPFDERQIQQFVERWYLAAHAGSPGFGSAEDAEANARQEAGDLLARLRRSPNLVDLSVNPLLLTMIVHVHKYRGTLPGHRADLYNEVVDVFLGRRRAARGITTNLTVQQQKRVLQALAYAMMTERRRTIGADEADQLLREPLARIGATTRPGAFLAMVERDSGLLLRRPDGTYGFAHPTFQEFLAAEHVRAQGLVAELAARVEEGWWQETIKLLAARSDATPLIEACLASRSVGAVTLAAECVEEALEVRPSLRQQVTEALEQRTRTTDPQQQHVLGAVRLMLRLREVTPLGGHVYVRPSLLAASDYAVFLQASADKGGPREPEAPPPALAWSPSGSAAPGDIPPKPDVAAVTRGADVRAFFDWLNRVGPPAWRYRPPRKGELPVDVRQSSVPAGSRVEGYWVLDGDALGVERRTLGGRWELTDAIILRDLHRGLPRMVAEQLDAVGFQPVADGEGSSAERWLTFGPPLPPLREWANGKYAASLAPELSLSGGSIPRAYPLALALCCFKLRRGGLSGVRIVRLPVEDRSEGTIWRVDVDILQSLFQRLANRANAVQHVDLDQIVDPEEGLLAHLRQLGGRWGDGSGDRYPAIQQTHNAIDALTRAFTRGGGRPSEVKPAEREPSEREELRWRVRMSCLFLAYEALVAREAERATGGPRRDGWRRLAYELLDAYAMLALFELRLRGRQPWSEGVLVVKEPALELTAE